MNNDDSKLASTLVWDDEGCLSEVAISAMSDGELELLPPEAAAHAETCRYCANLIGQTALFSLELAAALPEIAPPSSLPELMGTHASSFIRSRTEDARTNTPVPQRLPETQRPPFAALGLAAVLAVAGMAPRLDEVLNEVMTLPGKLAQQLPDMARLMSHGAASGALRPLWMVSACVAALLLVTTGLLIARLASHRGTERLERSVVRGGLS